jgi:hypothetical protein
MIRGTERAATVLHELLETSAAPPESGVRIRPRHQRHHQTPGGFLCSARPTI